MSSPVRARRLLVGAVVAVLVSLTTACAAFEEEPTPAADSPGAAAQDQAGSEPEGKSDSAEENGAAQESDAPEDQGGAAEESGAGSGGGPDEAQAAGSNGRLTTKSFLPALKKAVPRQASTHITMDLQAGGQTLSAVGDLRLDAEDPVMALTMRGPAFGGGEVEMRVVEDTVYLALPPMTPRGKFIEIDPNDPNDPLSAGLGDLTEQMDPLQSFAAFDAGLRKVEYVGKESVSGERLHRYRVKVDAAAASTAQGQPVAPGMPEFVDYHIWLDEKNLMRRVEFSLGQQASMEMTASQWGEPVTVQVPPRSKIMRRPPQLGGAAPS